MVAPTVGAFLYLYKHGFVEIGDGGILVFFKKQKCNRTWEHTKLFWTFLLGLLHFYTKNV